MILLSPEEILEASEVSMFLPNGELDPDQGYLTGRQQVAKAQLKAVMEILGESSIMFPASINHPARTQSYVGIPLNIWQALLKELE